MKILSLKNVRKEYHTGSLTVLAVEDVSFDLNDGEFVVILGASGAGKTTLLNLLGGMDTATDGEICGYIYREIYISVFLGIIVGYPAGIGLATLVFKAIGFGTVGNVSWFMWLLVPVVVFVFALLVTLILRPKIVKTRMNESLKAVE